MQIYCPILTRFTKKIYKLLTQRRCSNLKSFCPFPFWYILRTILPLLAYILWLISTTSLCVTDFIIILAKKNKNLTLYTFFTNQKTQCPTCETFPAIKQKSWLILYTIPSSFLSFSYLFSLANQTQKKI